MMRRSRLISCLGQVVIDSMVGMDKDSSSATNQMGNHGHQMQGLVRCMGK